MTDYNKWNRVRMEDLGWTEEDEVREKMTPAMKEMMNAQENDKRLREAKQSLAAARTEQARLQRLTKELAMEQQKNDKFSNLITVVSLVVLVLVLLGMRYLFPTIENKS